MSSRPSFETTLPIGAALPELLEALRQGPNAVLVAPPGAGKTTVVPLALLDQPWRGDGRILVLEPRRLAARAAADRLAATLGERVGETVGLRVRMDTRVGPRTRIEVVTDGVFTRLLLADPTLDGVAAVLFDEIHERSLDADLGLALALDAQAGLREDLRLLAMSATVDGARVAALLGAAPTIRSEGRAFPVETRYAGRTPGRPIEAEVADLVLRALREEDGAILAFLPGAREIRRTATLLGERLHDQAVEVATLHGTLDRAEQERALRPAPPGRRKVVLASAVAETSLTIEGVRVVVDSGLARAPRFEPDLGLTRLETVRVSRASADQRRGRAGRTAPGVCYRAWEETATGALEPFGRPEILSADLSGFVLDCAEWGVTEPGMLRFLDEPPRAALGEARALLRSLDALDDDGRITATGRQLRALPLPPRLARLVATAAERGAAGEGALAAALLAERGPGGDAVDLQERLDRVRREPGRRNADLLRLAAGWARTARSAAKAASGGAPPSLGTLVAFAYPDRIARARSRPGEFVMANGRGASLEPHLPLARERFLAVAEVTGSAAASRIVQAATIDLAGIETAAGREIVQTDEIVFEPGARALRGRSRRRLGAVVLADTPRPVPATPTSAAILARGIGSLGLDALPWSEGSRQLRDRAAFVRAAGGPAPDLSDEALRTGIEVWLAPHLIGLTALSELTSDALHAAVEALISWEERRNLDEAAPTHLTAPTGTRLPIDYAVPGGPAVSVRVQELFGLTEHPRAAGMRLVLHLLSPAGRPIQVTRDLPGFWMGSWAAVRAEMRGRYPRHPWPENPTSAEPTRRAKPRGT